MWRKKLVTGPAWPYLASTNVYKGNILCPMVNPNQKDSYKERILQDTRVNEDLPYKKRPSSPRNECQLYAIIKTPKPSQTKVHIIYPSSDTL